MNALQKRELATDDMVAAQTNSGCRENVPSMKRGNKGDFGCDRAVGHSEESPRALSFQRGVNPDHVEIENGLAENKIDRQR